MQHTPKHNHNPQVCTTLPLSIRYGCRTSASSGPSHFKYRSDQYLSVIQEQLLIKMHSTEKILSRKLQLRAAGADSAAFHMPDGNQKPVRHFSVTSHLEKMSNVKIVKW